MSAARQVIKPRALCPGMTIGLIAPSSALPEPERLDLAVSRLCALGFCVKVGESCHARYGNFAGSDAVRATDINRMFADDCVDGILCIRGGYGATRILDMIDYDNIRRHPKVLSGYSDVTALHSAIREKAGVATFHGLMAASDYGRDEVDAFSADMYWRVVGCAMPAGLLENSPDRARETIAPGVAEGPLIGGNLSLLAACAGTPYAYDYDGAILFIEEINEKTYACDRMLTQLRSCGAFSRCAGVLLGEFTNCEPENPDRDISLRQVFEDVIVPCGKPVLAGLACGHRTPKMTLPFGVRCRMDACAGTVEVLEAAVE